MQIDSDKERILIVYFSHSGNTRKIAKQIYTNIGGDLGYPNWWGTIPTPVSAFLAEHDLSGKTIAAFCTHGSGGLARTVEAIKKTCPDSKVLDALGIGSSRVNEAESEVSEWLSHINEK